MKAITKYQCEICGQECATEKVAMDCEASHPEVNSTDLQYGASNKYPQIIRVTFDDERVMSYRKL